MPPKPTTTPSAPASAPSAVKPSSTAVSSASGQPQKQKHTGPPSGAIRSVSDLQEIALGVWDTYQQKTEQRTKLLDAFMAFLVVVGAVQFVYCLVVGNYVSFLLSIRTWSAARIGAVGGRAREWHERGRRFKETIC